MTSKKLVSIIIVTYNAEKDIGSCLKKLKLNINDSIEIIVVDGLSNDNTVSIINDYKDIITVFISEKDSGIYDAMNKGIKLATGDFIYFLGADDELLINSQELSNILVDKNNIYYGDVVLSPSNKIYGGKFNTSKLINRNICHQSIFYSARVFEEFRYDNVYKYMADYALNLKLWASGRYDFVYLNEQIAVYSIVGLSSSNIDDKFKKDSFKFIYKYYGVYGVLIKMSNKLRNLIENKNLTI
jgi:glycosyltransferase involved in cell wall biosynthesis